MIKVPMAHASVSLVDKDAVINQKIADSLKPLLNKRFQRAAPKIKTALQKLLRRALLESPEYENLVTGGDLKKELGVDFTRARLETIISMWVNSVTVYVRPVRSLGSNLFGGISIGMVQADYSDVINLPDAHVITEKGEDLPWLEWLLLFGDTVIIRDYVVFPKKGFRGFPNPPSRTGLGIMIKKKQGSWRVPPQFSGTADDNWVVRALNQVSVELDAIVEKAIGE